MKTTLKKVARFSFALIIPAALLAGCQEDLTEPNMAHPPKVKTIPGEK